MTKLFVYLFVYPGPCTEQPIGHRDFHAETEQFKLSWNLKRVGLPL